MTIKLMDGRHLDQSSIDHLGLEVGSPLPESYRRFLQYYDGAQPESNLFDGDQSIDCSVTRFIPARKIADEVLRIEGLNRSLIPIANTEGGNYVVIDVTRNSEIYFWEHEICECVRRLALDFSEFIGRLQPFNPTKVLLRPEQVLDTWIDPDFLKKLNDN